MSLFIISLVFLALLFDFLNGMNDAANSVATIVSTKVLSPFAAVLWAAFFNFIAAFVFGVHVANTIGKGIIETHVINEYLILATLLGAIIWVYVCTHLGLPISVSHALVGGLVGTGLLVGGQDVIITSGVYKVLLFIILSPVIGFILSYFLMVTTIYVFRRTQPNKVDKGFRYLQLLSSAIFSLGHGTNDAQKTMGIIAVLLFTTGHLGSEFHVPMWIVLSAHTAIALGTLSGGWKVIKTLGMRLTELKPVHGFCAETAGAIAIIGASFAGIPVSTTHTITGSVAGVGVVKRVSSVRWGIAGNIIVAWILTIPGTMALSAGIYWLILKFI
ncbi:MAG TPA: inorganic phosphate transporter [Cyclobacteriaceae bacterium]|nr:inorganic phosphate transporter [Cyclobacteriaceae bacterium]